ncbi:MAG: hypothetical protein AAF065_05450 [Verrucomicrobiota bacterium]
MVGIIAFLSPLTSAIAVINLDFTEDGTSLVLTVSGVIDELPSLTPQSVDRIALVQIDSRSTQIFISSIGVFTAFDEYRDDSVSALPPGSPFTVPPTPNTANGVFTSGSNFRLALTTGQYTLSLLPGTLAGDTVGSVTTFANTSLADLGLPSSGAGVLELSTVSALPDITWGVNGVIVPEPSMFGFVMGCFALGVLGCRRSLRG